MLEIQSQNLKQIIAKQSNLIERMSPIIENQEKQKKNQISLALTIIEMN